MKEAANEQARAAHEAAQWLVRLQTGELDAEALTRWRQADAQHERAWQRAERILQSLGQAQGQLGADALRQADRAGRRQAVRVLAALLVASSSGLLAWQLAPWQSWRADQRTARGERRHLILPDGGQLWLDTASAVDIRYQDTVRALYLHEGGLFVETAADAAGRPFIVHTPHGAARALGTSFSVRLFDGARGQEAYTRVKVSSGAVALRALDGAEVRIDAGWQADTVGSGVGAPEAFPEMEEGWTKGVLYAEKMPLGQFVAELARYRPGFLRCDPEVADLLVSGAFRLDDTDAVLLALKSSLPVRIEQRTRYWVTIGPA